MIGFFIVDFISFKHTMKGWFCSAQGICAEVENKGRARPNEYGYSDVLPQVFFLLMIT